MSDEKKIKILEPEIIIDEPDEPKARKTAKTKRVERVTRESYEEPLRDESSAEPHAPVEVEFSDEFVEDDFDNDPLTEFLDRFKEAPGLRMQAVRFQDPPTIKPRVACYELTALPRLPFNAESFIADIQRYNENSGGYFKIQLLDQRGRFIEGASWTGCIANPPAAQEAQNFVAQQSGGQTDFDVVLNALDKIDQLAQKRRNIVAASPAQIPAESPKSLADQLKELATTQATLKSLFGGEEKQSSPPSAERASWLADLGYFANSIGLREVIVPFARQALASQLAASTQGNPNAQGNQNAAMPAPAADPVQATLQILIHDLTRNKRTGRAADAIEDLIDKQPEIKQLFGSLLAAPVDELLTQLSQISGMDLTEYAHAREWLEDLKIALGQEESADQIEAEEAGEEGEE